MWKITIPILVLFKLLGAFPTSVQINNNSYEWKEIDQECYLMQCINGNCNTTIANQTDLSNNDDAINYLEIIQDICPSLYLANCDYREWQWFNDTCSCPSCLCQENNLNSTDYLKKESLFQKECYACQCINNNYECNLLNSIESTNTDEWDLFECNNASQSSEPSYNETLGYCLGHDDNIYMIGAYGWFNSSEWLLYSLFKNGNLTYNNSNNNETIDIGNENFNNMTLDQLEFIFNMSDNITIYACNMFCSCIGNNSWECEYGYLNILENNNLSTIFWDECSSSIGACSSEEDNIMNIENWMYPSHLDQCLSNQCPVCYCNYNDTNITSNIMNITWSSLYNINDEGICNGYICTINNYYENILMYNLNDSILLNEFNLTSNLLDCPLNLNSSLICYNNFETSNICTNSNESCSNEQNGCESNDWCIINNAMNSCSYLNFTYNVLNYNCYNYSYEYPNLNQSYLAYLQCCNDEHLCNYNINVTNSNCMENSLMNNYYQQVLTCQYNNSLININNFTSKIENFLNVYKSAT